MSNRRKDVPGRIGASLGLGLRKRQVAGEPILPDGPTADTTAITADDTTNTADSF